MVLHVDLFLCVQELRFYHGHSDSITDVCFVSNTVLCSASLDATLSLWDVELGHR